MLSGDTPQCQQGKLLSARRIDDGTGESQAEEVIESLKDWKAIDYVVAQCFDTNSSNTGTYFWLFYVFRDINYSSFKTYRLDQRGRCAD